MKKCVWVMAALALPLISCNTDMFDEEDYNRLVEIAQPVSNIDKDHTWSLTENYSVTVDATDVSVGATQLLILSGNPINGDNVTILGQYPMSDGKIISVSFAAPSIMKKFYAALRDSEDTYTISSFTAGQASVGFSNALVKQAKATGRMGLQTFTYCFEDEMPVPGDYDYNDVVLRISHERTAENQITLNVTLAAVGADDQMAAAIRLPDYKVSDIESVVAVDGESFNEGYHDTGYPYIDSRELLISGSGDAAVINLFEDAHWATGEAYYRSEGYFDRYKYNVTTGTDTESEIISPRTVSYIITFKDATRLNQLTLNGYDVFTIIAYNGAFMEVHSDYRFRQATVLHEYSQPSSAVILPWALVVPTGSFRYPLHGRNIGYEQDGVLFGAYMTKGHGFGEWASNHLQALDWYDYPTNNMVF